VSTFDFPTPLLDLERTAWAAIQAGALTVEQADAVQTGVAKFAEETGADRHKVEMALKKTVRHPEG
jgi:hypothetical protein